MKLVTNRFYRVEPVPNADPSGIIASPRLTHPEELLAKIKPLDGIVVGSWDPDNDHGRVHALGIVQRVDGQSAVVDWRRADFTLRPTGQGAVQWRKRPVFKFADLVADRYRLAERFHDAFAGNAADDRHPRFLVEEPPEPIMRVTQTQRTEPDVHAATHRAGSSGPQCNRVAPDGEIFSTPERGLFMGNRTSPPRWLICDLHFQRDLKEPRKYTKLFFLDEAVALAAGHRPCNTCRRDQYQSYLAALRPDFALNGAGDLDATLNHARKNNRDRSLVDSLPDGAFIETDRGDFRLKWGGALYRWTPGGYVNPDTPADLQIREATVLTPEPSLAALRNGYTVVIHPSAR